MWQIVSSKQKKGDVNGVHIPTELVGIVQSTAI